MSTISASTTTTTAYKVTADTTGTLVLQTGSTPTTAATIDASQNVLINTSTGYGKFTVQNNAGTGKVLLDNYVSIPTTENVLSIYADASRGYIQSYNNGYKDIIVCGSGGNVGIGRTSPASRLDVNGRVHIRASGSDHALTFINQSGGDGTIFVTGTSTSLNYVFNTYSIANAMTLDNSGNFLIKSTAVGTGVGIQLTPNGNATDVPAINVNGNSTSSSYAGFILYSTSSGGNRFYASYSGTVYAISTTITGISDVRLKENIRDLDDGLEKVMALQPRKFDWKEGKGANIKNARGFIAQEFETVFPDMIDEWADPAPEGEEPYKAVNANLIPTLVKAIQEQQAIIEQLTNRITALEAK